MFKITGLDELQKELEQAQEAFAEIYGEIVNVSFNPNDPSSIENAIADVETMIDDRLGDYSNNSIVSPLIAEMKEKYREAILDNAAEARLSDKANDVD